MPSGWANLTALIFHPPVGRKGNGVKRGVPLPGSRKGGRSPAPKVAKASPTPFGEFGLGRSLSPSAAFALSV